MIGRGVVAPGLALVGLAGCWLPTDANDCAEPQHQRALGLITDCSGTYCEVDADCPSDRVCVRHSSRNDTPTGIPTGCMLRDAEGDGGAGP